jgi:membrane protease YdiL (CAAX protease family)
VSLRPALLFFGLACALSWSAELAGRALEGAPADALRAAAKFGPSVAGLIAAFASSGGSGVHRLVSNLARWRVSALWYALALFGPLALWAGAATARLGGAGRAPEIDLAALTAFAPLVARHFFAGGGLGEELGWRGFLQPALEPRLGFVRASLLVGVCWGLWHAPVFLLPTSGRSGGAVSLALFTALCCAYSLIFARVLHATRDSLLVVALLHAATNASENALKGAVPELRGDTATTLAYGGLVLALALVAALVRPPPRSHSAAQAASSP